jgi:hypothetical protein
MCSPRIKRESIKFIEKIELHKYIDLKKLIEDKGYHYIWENHVFIRIALSFLRDNQNIAAYDPDLRLSIYIHSYYLISRLYDSGSKTSISFRNKFANAIFKETDYFKSDKCAELLEKMLDGTNFINHSLQFFVAKVYFESNYQYDANDLWDGWNGLNIQIGNRLVWDVANGGKIIKLMIKYGLQLDKAIMNDIEEYIEIFTWTYRNPIEIYNIKKFRNYIAKCYISQTCCET